MQWVEDAARLGFPERSQGSSAKPRNSHRHPSQHSGGEQQRPQRQPKESHPGPQNWTRYKRSTVVIVLFYPLLIVSINPGLDLKHESTLDKM